MRAARLTLALDAGALVLPEVGQIAVLSPQAGDDLSALPKDRVQVVQGFWPDHDAFKRAGFDTTVVLAGPYSAVMVCLPRAKSEARAMIAAAVAAVAPGGLVLIDGQKTDGVDSLLRDCRTRAAVSDPVNKAHGKLFWFTAPDAAVFADWAALAEPQTIEAGFRTVPGVFSADGIDPGSMALAAALPAKLGGRVADLGAGWGYLTSEILKRGGVKEVHLVEADHAALEAAKLNITDPRAKFHWGDVPRFHPAQKMETVVMNPPFHTARTADPALGAAFIKAAGAMLVPSGVLWMVANRHLPYERVLAEVFREVEEAGGTGAFKIYRASRPAVAARPEAKPDLKSETRSVLRTRR